MAHHKSAKKRILQTETKNENNRARRSRVRTFVKRVETAVAAGDAAIAQEALRAAQSEMMSAVSKGVLKLGTVSRKTSRLSARVKALKLAA
jgi:small subunit ribosomal protein S20